MRILNNYEISEANIFFKKAREEALKSPLLRKIGGYVVKDRNPIAGGFNSIICEKVLYSDKKNLVYPKNFSSLNEKHISADSMAILNSLRKADILSIEGSKIYMVELNSQNKIICTNNYYSKQGSELALVVGIKEWIFLGLEGPFAYDSDEFYQLSLKNEEEKYFKLFKESHTKNKNSPKSL